MISGLITAGLALGLSPSNLITRGMAFGTQPIILQALAPSRYIPPIALITGTPGVGSLSPYRIFIAGVDRTPYVQRGAPNGPGIQINLSTGSRGTAGFTVFGWKSGDSPDTLPQYVPSQYNPVEIRRSDGSLQYRGFVDTLTYVNKSGHVSLVSQISCVDYGILCDRRIVNFVSGIFWHNAPADSYITQIVNQFLAGTGITFVYSSNVNIILGDQSWIGVTVTEVFNSIAQQTDTNWYIDADKNLRFYSISGGTTAAPETIDDSNTMLESMQITETAVRFANRWYAKTDQNIGNAVQVDSYTQAQAGWTGFLLTQAGPVPPQVPAVTVNGSAKRVIPMPDTNVQPNDTTWDFIYIGLSVVYNWRLPALQIGDVIEISYPSPLPFMAVAEDLTSIAAVGLYEAIVEVPGITDKVTLQAIAEEALERGKIIPISVVFQTRKDGYQPGQLVPINRTKLGIDDDFLVNAVSAKLSGNKQFHYQVTATNKESQLQGDAGAFASALISGLRLTTLNIIEKITFNLAVSTPPLTNPGLTTGIQPNICTAQKNGTAAWVTLIFNSLSQLGGVTTTDIVIDILKNGVSIYGPNILTLPAGDSAEIKFSTFASNPLLVKVGDIFTCNVISADPAAMDGVMTLVTLG